MTDTEKELEVSATTTTKPMLPLLPLKNVVILPKSIIPIIVGRPLSIAAVERALQGDRTLFVTSQKDQNVEDPKPNDLYEYGTRSTILQVMKMPNGSLKILAEGICRAKATSFYVDNNHIEVTYKNISTTGLTARYATELQASWRHLTELYIAYATLNDKAPSDIVGPVTEVSDMDYLTDTVAMHINNVSIDERQEILELNNLPKRMIKVCALLQKETEILQAEQRIRGRIQTQVEKNQKEYYLNEQMKAIQKELGRDDQGTEVESLMTKADALNLPEDALYKVKKELRRLEQMQPLSSESSISRNYIDWILSLPWTETSTDTISLEEAEEILNKNHAGLKKAKERILEFVAAKKFSKNLEKYPTICLVGPPGVGKTSLGKSIADSLGREFVRISLGGVRDEAEIRGHRRTYIGAMPGKIIQAMRKAHTLNPVILLDEIDKLAHDIQGDPAAALLEVLDPEQNKAFADHYLDIEYDLSKVIFIATANVPDNIPYPLFDRLEVISLSGYTKQEKKHIAQNFLIPKNLKEHTLSKRQFKLDEPILDEIIEFYTRESGVRQLDRTIAKLMRKTIQILLKDATKKSVTITHDLVIEWLGHHIFKKTTLSEKKDTFGLATGLAWTELGGDVLEIETSVLPGKGSVTLTGQLGDVMQESAQAAISYIRSRSKELGIKPNFYASKDIHIHLPEGATPKDGPSAGITICTALVSSLTEIPVKHDLAMTGEITLQGRVLGIGGLKEKLLAAKQHGFKTVIIPQENSDDLKEVYRDTNLDGLTVLTARTMDDVLQLAFDINPFTAAQKKEAVAKKRKKSKSKKKPVKTEK
jgi:ATP-dependent Lon protease